MFFNFFNKSENFFQISSGDRDKFCDNIIESSAPRGDFYFLVVLSALIVSFGVMTDNIVLVIGGMLVTPLLSPIMAIALGITILEPKVILRSLWVFFTASLMAAAVSATVGMISEAELASITVISKMKPDIIVFIIAATAGVAASYTWAKPNLNSTLPGIGITVTLIPPLTVFGFSIAKGDFLFLSNSFYSFLLNVCGIILSSIIVFFFLGFYSTKKKVVAEVKQEEKND
jgi:uncharacterized hydrophobic protein (TIGR00271 family)